MHKKLSIGFLHHSNPLDNDKWSGIIRSMYLTIQKHWGEVTNLQKGGLPDTIVALRGINKISSALVHKKYNPIPSLINSLLHGIVFNRRISAKKFDVLFAPADSQEIAFIRTQIPIIYAIDATFNALTDYYPLRTGLLSASIWEGNWIEQAALRKASIVISASPWARNSAINDYSISGDKIFTVPMGANFDDVPADNEIINKKKTNKCRLLFLGVNWERKGGAIAFDALLNLERMKIPSELTVCGCIPPSSLNHPSLRVIPYLNKLNKEQHIQFKHLLSTTDFLILPSRAECFGIVICEASAFGVPSIATDTGGVSGAISNGKNGYLLPYSATGKDFAELIREIYLDEKRYQLLSANSREFYTTHLNWDSWALSVRTIIHDKLGI